MLRLIFSVLLALNVARAATFNVAVTTVGRVVPSTLYGMMYEDIGSGDGGLYGELLQNRAFQQVTAGTTAALNAWSALGTTSHISVVKSSTPVSTALPNSLSLAIGFVNSGY
ncbi:hypothetical protein B0H17DRAFT_1204328 [Mycena rosella]|uniref:Uncharacterized protein n=1 Tax=Mycena rosella TaxID=1033263 RepID=A0AAD7GDV1_MYCRO|nr:hypothetical protein B0H17DRAFT_1204328 [Mycena rosella]